jgi:hypothetical protein
VDDIPALAAHFVRRASRADATISTGAVRLLQEMQWPKSCARRKGGWWTVRAAFGCGIRGYPRDVETALSYRSSMFRALSVSQHLVELTTAV